MPLPALSPSPPVPLAGVPPPPPPPLRRVRPDVVVDIVCFLLLSVCLAALFVRGLGGVCVPFSLVMDGLGAVVDSTLGISVPLFVCASGSAGNRQQAIATRGGPVRWWWCEARGGLGDEEWGVA